MLVTLAMLTVFSLGCTKVKKGVEQIMDKDKVEDSISREEVENDIYEDANDSINVIPDSIPF